MGEPSLDHESLMRDAMLCTKACNNFLAVSSGEYEYFTSFPSFKNRLALCAARSLAMIETTMVAQTPNGPKPCVSQQGDIDEVFDTVVDFADRQMERVDGYIEDISGLETKSRKWISDHLGGPGGTEKAQAFARVLEDSAILKPQLKFDDFIDNSNSPFVLKELAKIHSADPNARLQLDPPAGTEGHPYLREICSMNFLPRHTTVPVKDAEVAIGEQPNTLDRTPCVWIDNETLLSELADVLASEEEFAIDVKNHSARSYQGFTCLIQISTRTSDYLIDAMDLRSSLHLLLGPFTDPAITKVVYNSLNIVKWLQRDFSIFWVNVLDVSVAAKTLGLPHTLPHLLKQMCQVDSHSNSQSDWRVRPIPADMVKSARMDTHYLLDLAHRIKAKFTSEDQILGVLREGQRRCLTLYRKETLDSNAATSLAAKSTSPLSSLQLAIFVKLFEWRDEVARQEDESPRYVLPDKWIFAISEALPSDRNTLLTCGRTEPPHLVRLYCDTILAIVSAAASQAVPSSPNKQLATSHSRGPIPLSSPIPTAETLYNVAGWEESNAKTPLPSAKTTLLSVSSSANKEGGGVTISAGGAGSIFDNMHSIVDADSDEDEAALAETQRVASELDQATVLKQSQVQYVSASAIAFSAQKNPDVSPEDVDTEAEKVPRSMSEIYALSNRNRKRNKVRKLKKGDADEDPESEEETESKRAREGETESGPLPDATAFMKDIRWVKPGSDTITQVFDYAAAAAKGLAFQGGHATPQTFDGLLPEQQQKTPRQGNARMKSGNRSMTFKQGSSSRPSASASKSKSGGEGGAVARWPQK